MAICKILKGSSDVWVYNHVDGGYAVHVADVGVTTQHDGQQYRIYGGDELAGFLKTLDILGYKIPESAIVQARAELIVPEVTVDLTERKIRLLHHGLECAMNETIESNDTDLFLELKNLKDGLADEFPNLDLNRSFL